MSTHKHSKQLSFFDVFDDLLEKEGNKPELSLQNRDSSWSKKHTRTIYPKKLLIDFRQFMDYLEQNSIQLTTKMGYISKKHLPAINEQLSIKAKGATNHSQQPYYPYIHFLFHVALAAKLIKKINIDSSKPTLEVTDRWNLYKVLSNPEKYCFLLETFWIDVNWGLIINNHNNPVHLMITDVLTHLINNKHIQLDENPLLSRLTYDWNHFFFYLEWFGLWVSEEALPTKPSVQKRNYYAKSIVLTSFGEKIIPILLKSRNPHTWNIPFRSESGEINPIPCSKPPEEIEYNTVNDVSYEDDQAQPFYEAFTNIFPKDTLKKTLPRSERKYTPGIYTFKVAFDNSSWCRVMLSANHTMSDLHEIIMRTFQFDGLHLYSFFLDGRKWSKNCIVSPMEQSGDPIATEITIGSVGLQVEQRLLYLFDYGAGWTFTINVEQIEEKDSHLEKPYLMERKGHGPEQYFFD